MYSVGQKYWWLIVLVQSTSERLRPSLLPPLAFAFLLCNSDNCRYYKDLFWPEFEIVKELGLFSCISEQINTGIKGTPNSREMILKKSLKEIQVAKIQSERRSEKESESRQK